MAGGLLDRSNPLIAAGREGRRFQSAGAGVAVAVGGALAIPLLGFGLGGILGGLLLPSELLAHPLLPLLSLGLPFGGLWIATLLWVRLVEGRPFPSVGLRSRAPIQQFVVGAALGSGMLAASVGLSALLGGQRLAESNELTTGLAALPVVVAIVAAWCIQGSAEEVYARGWLLQAVGSRFGVIAGVVAQAAIFTLLHGLNPGISALPLVNLALVAVYLALYALDEGGLWGVFGWHAAWNWAQGNLFGIRVSGTSPVGGAALVDLEPAGIDLISGGAFGIEASFTVTVVVAAGILGLLSLRRRAGRRTGMS